MTQVQFNDNLLGLKDKAASLCTKFNFQLRKSG